MADNLPITSGGGSSQTTTGNPQNVPTANSGPSTNSSGVQPGTASTLLTTTDNANGVPLGGQNLTTVNLNASATTTSTVATSPPAAAAKTSPVIEVVAIGLLVLAIVAFVIINRSAKTTTNY